MVQKLLHFAKAGGKPLVFEQVTIPANGTKDYSLVTLMPTDNAQFDLSSARISVKLLDDQVGSDTNGYFIDAESTVSGGIKTNGAIRIRLYRGTAATVLVRIDRPFKRLP
jgi:hypothetical protein